MLSFTFYPFVGGKSYYRFHMLQNIYCKEGVNYEPANL